MKNCTVCATHVQRAQRKVEGWKYGYVKTLLAKERKKLVKYNFICIAKSGTRVLRQEGGKNTAQVMLSLS